MGKEIDNLWSEFEKEMETSKTNFQYLKPEFKKEYLITISSFKLSKRSFMPTTPIRWTIDMQLKTINGEPTSMQFGTQSLTIINKLAPYKDREKQLQKTTFSLMKVFKDGKTRYEFDVVT